MLEMKIVMNTRSNHGLTKLLLLMAGLVTVECHAVTLVFDKHVEIRGQNIRLKDIARVEDAGEWTSRLGETDLGKAPAVGRTERLSSEQITRWVRNRFPQLERIQWRGAKELVLHAATRVVPADLLVNKAREVLAVSSSGHEQWQLLPEHPVRDLVVPDMPYVLDVTAIRATKRCERTMVRIDAKADGWVLASTTVWLKNERATNSSRNSSRNEHAGEKALLPVAEGMDRCSWLPSDRFGLQAEARASPDVARMDVVTVEMNTPALSIETKGIALGNGKVGETVRVKRVGTSDMFLATVSGKGRVQIVEGVIQ
jgi:hypothetical protein